VEEGEKERGTLRWSKVICDRCGDATFRIHPILITIVHATMLGLWSMTTGIGFGYSALKSKVGEEEKELATPPEARRQVTCAVMPHSKSIQIYEPISFFRD
jgi:hypothetical protein